MKKKKHTDWSAAIRHLRAVDPILAKMIKRVGPCTIVPRRDYYHLLCVAIFNQQISTKIAKILFERFRNLFPQRKLTPRRVFDLLSQTQDMAPRCGLSRQKRKYLIDLSQKFLDKKIPTRKFANMSEEQIIESLTQINGVGQWTAEMFLMFVLNRPDVLPVDDLGLREAVKRAYKLRERPDAKRLKKIAEPWRPWRTVATWYLWRGMENE